MQAERLGKSSYKGDSICNDITLITPLTHTLELYTIYRMKDQGLTFPMEHKTLFYHSYLSTGSYRRLKKVHVYKLYIFSSGLKKNILTK